MVGRSGIALLATIAICGGAAFAQQTTPVPPGQSSTGQQQTRVSPEQAIQMARNQGMVDVRELDRDGNVWEIEGHDAQGQEIEFKINILTGEVVSIERG
jgi:uncharacterized membrane protein YkoI